MSFRVRLAAALFLTLLTLTALPPAALAQPGAEPPPPEEEPTTGGTAKMEEPEEPPVPEGPHPMTAEDLWAMERVGSPAVSPDGAWTAFTVTRFDAKENKGKTDLWLVPTDGSAEPRRLTWHEASSTSPLWSPDGRTLAFLSKRGEGPPSLHLLPMQGGEAEPVTELPIPIADARWLPDGSGLIFAGLTWPELGDDFEAVRKRLDAQKDDKVGAEISESRLLRFWDTYKTDGRLQHFFHLDLKSRKVRDLTPEWDELMGIFGLGGNWDLAPDGREIVFSANSTDAPYRELNEDLYLLPLTPGPDGGLEAGEARNITSGNPATDAGPLYTRDGRFILFARNARVEIAPDFARYALYERASGEITPLASGWDGQAGGGEIGPRGEYLYFTASEEGRGTVYRIRLADGAGAVPERVARGGVLGGLRVAPAAAEGGTRLVYTRESITSPAVLVSRAIGAGGSAGDPGEGGEATLASFNEERLAEIEFGPVEDVTFAGAGGDPVHMFIVYPPGFDRGKKWPLLQLIHGGPHGAFQDSFHYRWSSALFASRGHVVVMVNFHGSTGYGQRFAESILGNHADMPFEDIMKATDVMLERGFIDESRMAAAGGSYGGYMVSWILGHTNRFAALVDHAGVYDLMAQFASDATWGRANNYGGAPWTDPARIDLYSPSRFAENFETPTLILHCEKDYRVPYTQGVNLHGVLQGKGVDSRIVIFPQENHWILKPQSAFLWWQEVFGWLERYAPGGGR